MDESCEKIGIQLVFRCRRVFQALQNYLWQHPALLDVTDKKLLKFTESCLERVDMLEFKVRDPVISPVTPGMIQRVMDG